MSNRAGFPGTPQWAFDPDQFPERTLEDWHRPVTLPPPANGNGRAHRGEYQARGNPGYNMPTQPGFGPQAIQRAGNARLPELHEQFDQQLQIGQRRDLNRGRTAHPPGGHGYVIIQDGAPPRFVDTPQEYGQAPQGYSMTQPRPRGRGHDNYGPY
ncbi:hypothetical protein FLAG1_11052 [Fusarium langsethiae]|uniref:Uncharacterized protein n=1 Tax=Fusarium langsethiae TaxID=179993 RepID=A0A0N0DB38_FUSLA|nr:hypothetical protein FLAG1_11052 [Fusarium langsethiae]